jgi:predicted nucleotidyltransferase
MPIRLSEDQITSLCRAFLQFFAPGDALWIFGSRIKPEERGGDIDLYVETQCQDADQVVERKLNFLVALKRKLGERKIDVVVRFRDYSLPIHDVARGEGVRLV